MVKYYIIALAINILLLIGHLFTTGVEMHIYSPAEAGAGGSIDVEIELHKGSVRGFARFQQELPYGVTATPIHPADVSFTFEDNTIKLIWLNLPPEEVVTVRYRLHFHERLKGNLELGGTFSYIVNNQRRSVMADGSKLTVNPSPAVDPHHIVDISHANEKIFPTTHRTAPGQGAVAIRQDPVADDEGYIVNILVSKHDQVRFAKIEETIPDDYVASEVESKGGIFTFGEQEANIIWKTLPSDDNFIASYRLTSRNGTASLPEPEGAFSFMHNELTTTIPVIQKDVNLKILNQDDLADLAASVLKEFPVPEYTSPAHPLPVSALPGTNKPLEPEPGVYYRVQVAAGHKPVDADLYFRSKGLNDDVRTELHEGWIKYTIGSWYDYKSARDQRVRLWNNTPITDAFVSAYNDGVRITVQEALIIANHRWYP